MDKDTKILLDELRNQIDTIDKELVYLLSRRFHLVKSI
jgi:chorismate mutase